MKTNIEKIQNDLMDVVRLFALSGDDIEHFGTDEKGVFYNRITIGERVFEYSDCAGYCGELEYMRMLRRFAKLSLYDALTKTTGKEMSWGALTGVRPTKLAYMQLEKGEDYHSLFEKMHVSKANIALVERVLKAQEGVYSKNQGDVDFFVSIPFCPTKCDYCSFITAPIEKTRQYLEDYVTALEREIEESIPLIKNLRSVYIGGGTPLVLDEKLLERVLKAVDKVRTNGCEYTVEAGRSDVFTKEKLDLLKEHNVTRICINAQSFCDKTLTAIGRKHTASQVFEAFEMANDYPFSINCDLIAGLEGESFDDFAYSVEKAVECNPDNITVHTLCLKKGAKLREEVEYLSEGDIEKMVMYSRRRLTECGYVPYYMYRQKYMAGNLENVGWCKEGTACVYNVDIMEETTDNLAVGSNAVSKKVCFDREKIERLASPKDFKTYFEKLDKLIEDKKQLFSK